MRFDLVDLRLFISAATHGNLTRAAESIPMALAAASARIKALEESLCVCLFERRSRGLALTPPGEVFMERALAMLKETARLKEDLLQFEHGTRGTIRMYANTNAINEFLPGLLASFLSRHPQLNVEMAEHTSQDIVQAVDEGEVEFGIIAGPVNTRGLQTYPFRSDRLVLVTPRNHPMSRRESLCFYETLDWDFIGLGDRASIQVWLRKTAMLLGQSIRFRIQVGSFDAVCRMVEAGVGVSIIPQSTALRMQASAGIHIVQLDDDWAERDLKLVMRSLEGLAPHARKLVEDIAPDLATER